MDRGHDRHRRALDQVARPAGSRPAASTRRPRLLEAGDVGARRERAVAAARGGRRRACRRRDRPRARATSVSMIPASTAFTGGLSSQTVLMPLPFVTLPSLLRDASVTVPGTGRGQTACADCRDVTNSTLIRHADVTVPGTGQRLDRAVATRDTAVQALAADRRRRRELLAQLRSCGTCRRSSSGSRRRTRSARAATTSRTSARGTRAARRRSRSAPP